VLWVVRECLSGEVLCASSMLSATEPDLSRLITSVVAALPPRVTVAGVISDGQQSLRKAVAKALPGVPHQLCHFHYLREAARPLYEMDRHAAKELTKKVRGVRPIERALEGRNGDGGPESQAARADTVPRCAAPSATTDARRSTPAG